MWPAILGVSLFLFLLLSAYVAVEVIKGRAHSFRYWALLMLALTAGFTWLNFILIFEVH